MVWGHYLITCIAWIIFPIVIARKYSTRGRAKDIAVFAYFSYQYWMGFYCILW
ncbi:hypothetical protein HMPREF1326_00754 [Akkermansia sp. KLE1605]|nr:hypothetical protein HMPREF1326_00754 [Akkermansia sp. KLE1605]